MTKKHFIITLDENLVVKQTSGTINRNSNGSQWFDVSLDNWKLNEGEELYIKLSHTDPDSELVTDIGPLHLFFNKMLGRYITLAPPELICIAGFWTYSIELRFNICENGQGEILYNSLTSALYSLTVVDSIMSATKIDSYIKEIELLSAAETLGAAVAVGYSAENIYNAVEQVEQAKAETLTAANIIEASIDKITVLVKDEILVFTPLAQNAEINGEILILKGGL